ncbi:MAG: leucyl aminopeptidase [Deltaproteobacteria bacterium]|nr:leucyl aminopeptidase [Deltaproteobacteria bacterium]
MKIDIKVVDPAVFKTPALIVFLFSDDKPGLRKRPELSGLKALINPRLKSRDFTANHLAVLGVFQEIKKGPARLILVGLGSEQNYEREKLRSAAAKAAQAARDFNLKEAAILLPPKRKNLNNLKELAEITALGVRLGLYKYDELKTREREKGKGKGLDSITLIPTEKIAKSQLTATLKKAEVTAEAVSYARDLVNRPSNLLKPSDLVKEARALAGRNGIKIKVISQEEAKHRKMGAFLAVAQGSESPGRIIVLEYRGTGQRTKPIALLGKAITFDSGGINLKPATGLKDMKTDMAGGAAVMAVLGAAARLKLKTNLVGIVPTAENMPSGKASRPGDVITSMSGLKVEITNTDAEGRMVLADAITLAHDYDPRAIIDLATLTGAVSVALGNKIAGLMGTNQDLVDKLKAAGTKSGDRVWELPLYEDYFDFLKSEVADFTNAGGREAGTIQGALFLKQFAPEIPWAHLDIAGTARAEKSTPDTPVGGTGFGVNLLLHFLYSNQ